MTSFLVQTYIFFYIFTRFHFAHAKTENEAEEFSYSIALMPFIIEMMAVSLILIELFEKITGKSSDQED